MDLFQFVGALVLVIGGLYALWLCVYQWKAMLDVDPSIQRLANVFGPAIARIIAIIFSLGFMLLGVWLLLRHLL